MAVFTAIGAAIFGAGTFGALATAAALQIAAGIAVSLLGQALSGADKKANQASGVQGTLQWGGDLSRTIMFGYGATAGSLVYANTWGNSGGTPNAFFTQVICVGDYPVTSLAQVWVNGDLCTLDATPHATRGYPVLKFRKSGKDHLWIKFYDGTQTTADSFLTTSVTSASRPYQSTRVGTGCPYVIATSLVNDGLFSGYPSFKFALNGAKLYDISKDSTAGGSGTHLWATRSTWGGDGDTFPAVQAYNLLRGITLNSAWLYGLQGMPAARVPNADWVAAINKCRATITGPSGSEATYRSGGEIRVNAPIADAMEAILTTCQGRLAEIGGTYKLKVGAAGASVFSFNDDIIISTEEQSFTPFFGLSDTINGISATYPSPAEGWNAKVAPPIFSAANEILDGNRRLMADVSLDMVPYKGQVQRLMKSALAEARRARRHTFVLPPEAFVLEPGDIIDWTSTRNGYVAKLFRVDGVSDRANLDVMVDITEVDPSDYAWNQAVDYTIVSDGPVVSAPPAAQAMTGWSVAAYTYPDSVATGRRIGISVTFQGAMEDIRAVRIQVREGFGSANTVWDSGEQSYDIADADPVTRRITWAGIIPNTAYEVRGIFMPISGRDAAWSAWLPVTTPDIGLSLADLGIDITAWQSRASNSIREVHDAVQSINLLAANAASRGVLDRKTLREELSVTVGTVKSDYAREVQLYAGPGSAIALRTEDLQAVMDAAAVSISSVLGGSVTTLDGATNLLALAVTDLEATVNDPTTGVVITASALSALTVQVSTDGTNITANLAAITALQGQLGNTGANSTFRLDVTHTPSAGWTAAAALQVSVTAGGTSYDAGLYLESKAGSARVVLLGDQVVISNGGTVAALFEAGAAYIANARIRNLTSSSIVVDFISASTFILDGVVITAKILNNNVTNTGSAITSTTSPGVATTTETTIQTLAFTPVDGKVLVKFTTTSAVFSSSSTAQVTYRLKRAGTLVASITLIVDDIPSTCATLFYIDTSPGTSSVTWTVTAQNDVGGVTIIHQQVYLECLNIKK